MNADIEYKKLVEHVLINGSRRSSRSGETLDWFGYQYTLDVNPEKGFPLLTTKKINFDNVYAELMWFLKGSESIKDLRAPQLWKPWAQDGWYLPKMYGYQWVGLTDTEGYPVNQIEKLIYSLKEDPDSRRHLVDAWNVQQLHEMPLNPCHFAFQCNVEGEFLDLQLYQRSGDIAIGIPYNMSSYVLLMYMLGAECDLTPRRFSHCLGSCHIYVNHLEKLIEQIQREPKPLPYLALSCKGFWERVKDDSPDDYILTGYDPHLFIKYPVAV